MRPPCGNDAVADFLKSACGIFRLRTLEEPEATATARVYALYCAVSTRARSHGGAARWGWRRIEGRPPWRSRTARTCSAGCRPCASARLRDLVDPRCAPTSQLTGDVGRTALGGLRHDAIRGWLGSSIPRHRCGPGRRHDADRLPPDPEHARRRAPGVHPADGRDPDRGARALGDRGRAADHRPARADLLNGVAFLDDIRSESVPGLSSILLIFEPGTNLFEARQVVHRAPDAGARAAERLEAAADAPAAVVDEPRDDGRRLLARTCPLSRCRCSPAGRSCRGSIGVPGVANVAIWGHRDRQLQVQVDPERLRDTGVTLLQVDRDDRQRAVGLAPDLRRGVDAG